MKTILFILLFALSAFAQNIWTVEKATPSDGDTITLDYEGKKEKVRFIGNDAPEKTQAFGKESKAKLASLIDGKTLIIKWKIRDQTGRILGQVFVGDLDVNLEMLKGGFSWLYYVQNVPKLERQNYIDAFENAKKNKLGLFAEPATEPSIFRKAVKCAVKIGA